MFVFDSKELTLALQYINEGRYVESLQLLNDFEERENISLQDIVSCHFIKSRLFFMQGLMAKAAKLAEQTYKESLGLEKNIMSVDCLFLQANALMNSNNVNIAIKVIRQGEKILSLLEDIPETEKNRREATLQYLKGMSLDPALTPTSENEELALKHYNYSLVLAESFGIKVLVIANLMRIAWIIGLIKGNSNLALDYIERALIYSKEINSKLYMTWALLYKATIYSAKGEITRCIPIFKHSLAMAKELNHIGFISSNLNNMADTFRMSGDLNHALECSEESIRISSDIDDNLVLKANLHDYLIQILIEMGDLEKAQEKFSILEQVNNQIENRFINEIYLYNKALILKESSRISSIGKAEEILKQMVEDGHINWEGTQKTLLTLCELLIMELQITGDLEVLADVESYIIRLLEVAEKSHSFWIWGETFLLQAKLALISLDLEKARKLLTQGQQIADTHGLNLLANKISNEHDKLLKQQSIWENLKSSKAPLNERIKLAGISEQVESMIRRRVIEFSDHSNEEPVFLLIVSKGGKSIFSHLFEEDQPFKDHLFGGFLSAINSFINETFSEGLDRVIFGEHTILVNSLSSFFICYVFKGQTYPAQLRIKSFIEEIQSDKEVWQTFEKFYKANREVQLKDVPSLKPLIKETFIDSVI
ncbi:MAG: hypothetical protein ACXAAH_07925 [Promethearchaeota archaeon]|jgi:tetratricopeptide (TPR) repeat protein